MTKEQNENGVRREAPAPCSFCSNLVQYMTTCKTVWHKCRIVHAHTLPEPKPTILNHPINRRQAAVMNGLKFLNTVSKRLYFWTFTFPKPLPDWWAGGAFSATWQRVQRKLGGSAGIRVFELHKSHGIHIHMVINRRYPVTEVRRIFKIAGFGRIHVEMVQTQDIERVAFYLGKYMTKVSQPMFGVRRVAVWGMSAGKQRSQICNSRASTLCRILWSSHKRRGTKPSIQELRHIVVHN